MLTLQTNLKHNGANTNLYCDGKFVFVTGCPACDEMYEHVMNPRRKRAKELADELKALGFTDINHAANLWKITARGTFNGRRLSIEDTTGKHESEYLV